MSSAVCCCLRLHVCVYILLQVFTCRPHWPWDDQNKMHIWKTMTSSSHCKEGYALLVCKYHTFLWDLPPSPVHLWYYAVFKQNKLVTQTTAAKSWGCDAHLCILKNLFGSNAVTEENIDHWHNCLKKARRVCRCPIVVMLSSLWFTGWCYAVVR